MNKLKHGVLLSIEGIDGSGKTTLVRNLYQLLKDELPVIVTREPGNTALGKQIRTLVQEKTVTMDERAEYLLFAADRAQHFNEVIIPHLNNNKFIISDRLADSSLVYQGYGRGLSLAMIEAVNQWVMHEIKPHLTLYVRVSTQTALTRIKERAGNLSSFEKEQEIFFERLVNGFDELFKNRQNSVTLDGEESTTHITQNAYTLIRQWIDKNNLLF